jgi:hypothetical protein
MIRRAPREQGFTVLQNDTLEDDRLSWEALGLLSFLLSKPDDWTVSKQHLISCRDAGDHKIKRILGELQDAGYLTRQRTQDDEGKFVWQSVVYDTPQRDNEPIPRKSIDGSSTDGSSIDGEPPDITKTDSNKEGSNKHGGGAPARGDEAASFSELVATWRDIQATPHLRQRHERTFQQWDKEGVIDDLDTFRDVLEEDAKEVRDKDCGLSLSVTRQNYEEEVAILSPQRQQDEDWSVIDGEPAFKGVPVSQMGPQNVYTDRKDGSNRAEPEVSAS